MSDTKDNLYFLKLYVIKLYFPIYHIYVIKTSLFSQDLAELNKIRRLYKINIVIIIFFGNQKFGKITLYNILKI